MPRLLAAIAMALVLLATGSPGASAGERDRKAADPGRARAAAALDAARALAEPARSGEQQGREATLALLDLHRGYDDLPAAQKAEANQILARPTDPGDFTEYQVDEATPVCGANVCVHYVASTADAPPMTDANANGTPDWVETNLEVMESVWAKEVTGLGFRAPAKDGSAGGDARFDVYLANLGDQSIYGYCAPETPVSVPDPSYSYLRSGYCVLDDDFAEFPLPGMPSLRVTAAHEFFHAIQFNYDAFEDPWIMEATATWMEERYADDVNDSRSYLKYGQLVRNTVPLDRFEPDGLAQYGNWIFFERLSQTYGAAALKNIWTRLDATEASSDQYSTQAVASFLASRSTTFRAFYARFAAGNLIPARTYSEGGAYPKAPIASSTSLSAGTRSTGTRSLRLDHHTNRNFAVVPKASLTGAWRLKVVVDGPPPSYGTTGYVLVHKKDGTVAHRLLVFDSTGRATYHAPFSPTKVARVTVTIGNASTRFDCWKGTYISCQGSSRDNARSFTWSAQAVR